MTSGRVGFIDIAKGLGIIAVVWAHIMLSGWSHRIIYAFHMPLFFFLSGVLFDGKKYDTFGVFFKKRFSRLMIPYLVYSVASWLLWVGFKWVRHDALDGIWQPLMQVFIAQGSGAFIVYNSALWFIPCLFAVEILYYYLSRGNAWISILICFILGALSFFFGSLWGDRYWFLLPWNFDAALIALPFYCVGNQIRRHFSLASLEQLGSKRPILSILAICVLSLALLFLSERFGECSMGSSSYQCSGFVFYVRAFVGIASLLIASILVGLALHKGWCKRLIGFVKWLGQTSLDVMCTHIPIKGVCMLAVAALCGVSVGYIENSFAFSLLSFIIAMAIVTAVVYAIHFVLKRIHEHSHV